MEDMCCFFYTGFRTVGNEIGYSGKSEGLEGAVEANVFVSSGIYRSAAAVSDEANANGEHTSLCSFADD